MSNSNHADGRAAAAVRIAIKREGLEAFARRAGVSENAVARFAAEAPTQPSTATLILSAIGPIEESAR